jgi:hypothetical protein
MLKGTGTRASKSRLATLAGAKRQSSPQPSECRKEDKKIPLASFARKKSKGRGAEEDRLGPRLLELGLLFDLFACFGGRGFVAGCDWTRMGEGGERGDEGRRDAEASSNIGQQRSWGATRRPVGGHAVQWAVAVEARSLRLAKLQRWQGLLCLHGWRMSCLFPSKPA